MPNKKEQLTEKETETFKILVRLGDSEELALKTVINERVRPDNHEVYRNAYCN